MGGMLLLLKNMVTKMIKFNFNSSLHWTTVFSEKLLLAVIGGMTMFAAGMDIYSMIINMKVELGDLFLLFIYAEIVGMVGAFLYQQQNFRNTSNYYCNDSIV